MGESLAKRWQRRLVHALPLLLGLATLLAVLHEVSFQRDHRQRLALMNNVDALIARSHALAATARYGGDVDIEALGAVRSVAQSLSQTLSAPLPAPAWLAAAPQADELARGWQGLSQQCSEMIALAPQAKRLRVSASEVEDGLSRLRESTAALLERIVAIEARGEQTQAVAEQLMRVERMVGSAHALIASGPDRLAIADRLGRDAVMFGDVNTALRDGAREQRIVRINDDAAQDLLGALGREFRQLVPAIEYLLGHTGAQASLVVLAIELEDSVNRVRTLAREHVTALEQRFQLRRPTPGQVLWIAVLSVLGALASVLSRWHERREMMALRAIDEDDAHGERAQLERARDVLVNDMQQLASDLHRLAQGQAEFASHRPIARDRATQDAFQALERVAQRVRAQADQDHRLLRGTQLLSELARGLRDEATLQCERVDQVGVATRSMAAGVDALARDGQTLGEVARASGGEARRANEAVGDTVRELGEVQAGTEECVRRIERLELAARELVNIRILIEDVSEVGKLLSLNVAIQASTDTPASRALSSFADEVQRLAERARSALVQIDLVQGELHEEAERASAAIKESLWRTRSAMGRAQRAGETLKTLDEASTRLEELGTQLVRDQRAHALKVTDVVRAITALHAVSGQLREQVDATVGSTLALGDASSVLDASGSGAGALSTDVIVAATPVRVTPNAQREHEAPRRIVDRY